MREGPGELLFHEKATDERGNLFEARIWKVPAGPKYPDGVRYRLAFIRSGENRPAVLYDNHHPKGHHRHVGRVEETYRFVDVEHLIKDFLNDVAEIKGGEQ